MANRALVLDVNILIRAVLGNRVRPIIERYADSVSFFAPEPAYLEAEGHLAVLVEKRGGAPAKALALLRAMVGLVDLFSEALYSDYEAEARKRSVLVTPTTGRFLHPLLHSVVRSGPKTPTSSDAALAPGRRIASKAWQ